MRNRIFVFGKIVLKAAHGGRILPRDARCLITKALGICCKNNHVGLEIIAVFIGFGRKMIELFSIRPQSAASLAPPRSGTESRATAARMMTAVENFLKRDFIFPPSRSSTPQ